MAEGDAVEAPSLVRFDGVVIVGVDMVFFFFFPSRVLRELSLPFGRKCFEIRI